MKQLLQKSQITDFSLGLITELDADTADVKLNSVKMCENVDFGQGKVTISEGLNVLFELGSGDLENYPSTLYNILAYKKFRITNPEVKDIEVLILRNVNTNEVKVLAKPVKFTYSDIWINYWTDVYSEVSVYEGDLILSDGVLKFPVGSYGNLNGYIVLSEENNSIKSAVLKSDENYNYFFGLPKFTPEMTFSLYSSYGAYRLKSLTNGSQSIELKYIDVISNALRFGIEVVKNGVRQYEHFWFGWVSWDFNARCASYDSGSESIVLYPSNTTTVQHKGNGLSLELRDFASNADDAYREQWLITIYDNVQYSNRLGFKTKIYGSYTARCIQFRYLMPYSKRLTGYAYRWNLSHYNTSNGVWTDTYNKIIKCHLVDGKEIIFYIQPDISDDDYEYGDRVIAIGNLQVGATKKYAGYSFGRNYGSMTADALLNINDSHLYENMISNIKKIEQEYVYGNRCYAVISDEGKSHNLVFSHINGFGNANYDSFPYKEEEVFGYFTVNPEGNECVAIAETLDRDLLIFTRKSFYLYTLQVGSKYVNKSLINLSNAIGLANKNAVVRTEYGVFWADDNGVYKYSGGIKPPENIALNKVLNYYKSKFNSNKIKLAYYGNKSEILVYLDEYGEDILAYEILYNRWKRYSHLDISYYSSIVSVYDNLIVCKYGVFYYDKSIIPYNASITTQSIISENQDIDKYGNYNVVMLLDSLRIGGIFRNIDGDGVNYVLVRLYSRDKLISTINLKSSLPSRTYGYLSTKLPKSMMFSNVNLQIVFDTAAKQELNYLCIVYSLNFNNKRGYNYV